MKVRRISISTKLFLALAILMLLGNGFLGLSAYRNSQEALFQNIQGNAMNIAQVAAAHVSGDMLKTIQIGEEGTEAYNYIIDQLALFRDNTDLEYIYTLRENDKGEFEFVVDSDTEEPASVGDLCEETEALAKAFDEGITTVDDEPFTDEWGVHISAYSPIFDGDEIVGAVGVDISATSVSEQMMALRNLVLTIGIGTYVVSLFAVGLLMLRFKARMKKLNNKVKELASGSGDLTKEIDIRSGDEIEVIAGNMNRFIAQVRSLVKDVAKSTEHIIFTGEELKQTVTENSQIMSDMNVEISDISANMERSSDSSKVLSQNLAESADNISNFAESVNDIRGMVRKANENAQATAAMARDNRSSALEAISALQERMRETSKDAQKIQQVKKIADKIGSIASQTSLLSLNAQVESARAGEAGKGFAVVATEVRNLSDVIDKAANEINKINDEALKALYALTDASEEMIRFVSEDVVRDYDAFANLGEEYGNTTDSIYVQMSEIGEQSTQISHVISDINSNVQNITATVTSTAESAKNIAASTGQITKSLEELRETSEENAVHSSNLNEQVNKYTYE